MQFTRLRGKWDLQAGSAAGCSTYGRYTFNPKYLLHVTQECELLVRLLVLESETETDESSDESMTKAMAAVLSINVSVFESTPNGTLLLSTTPEVAYAGATSAHGAYVDGAPSGVLAKASRRFAPGWYIVLPSTSEPQELHYELRLYASTHVDVRCL